MEDDVNLEEAYFRFLAHIDQHLAELPALTNAVLRLAAALDAYALLSQRQVESMEATQDYVLRMLDLVEGIHTRLASNPPSTMEGEGPRREVA